MNLKKVIGLCAAAGLGVVAGIALGYVKAIRDIDEASCPENCECAGECAMCAGAHTVAAEAEAAAAAETAVQPVEAPVEPAEPVSADVAEGVSEDVVPAEDDAQPADEGL